MPSFTAHASNTAPAETQTTPSIWLPMRFMVLGLLSLFGALGSLLVRPDLMSTYHYNQYIIAVTHLFVLGFGLSVVMGAMYQLVPIALETRLHSERVGRWQFILHLIGVAGMVWMFWQWKMEATGHFASVLAVGVGLFVYNIWRTLKTVPRRTLVSETVASVLGWLSFTILAGLYLVASKCWTFSPFGVIASMHAHAHVGALGVFLLLIMGISYKLIPMFMLSRIQSERRAVTAIRLMNIGIAGLFVTILLDTPLKLAFALLILVALILYGLELSAMVRSRMKKSLDWGVRYFLTAIGLLGPLGVIALILCWPGLPATQFTTQLENVYGFIGFYGVVALAILGMLYKILPFLVWYQVYGDAIGHQQVPAMADLYAPSLQAFGYVTYLAGLVGTSVGALLASEISVRAGAAVMTVSLACFALNTLRILSHLIKPSVKPLLTSDREPPLGRTPNATASTTG